MAEQEACAELVEKASDEVVMKESGSTVHGESLLLPLLQGLLDKPENDQPIDSGTESGEDLRSGLILEVQSALDKLSTSLKSPSTNISEERRDSLLQMVNRLQAGLNCQLTPSSSGASERRSSLNQGKFSKRKQRPNRHTVGVTSEELEDARRLMAEITFRENSSNAETTRDNTPLQKQNSEGSVLQTPPFKPLSKTNTVKNVTAKPFISSNVTSLSQSGTSSTVDTPSETSGSLEFLLSSPEKSQTEIVPRKNENTQPTFHHSKSLELQTQFNKKRPLSEAISLDYSRDVDLLAIQKAVTQAAAIKQLSQLKSDVSEGADDQVQESESDDEAATVKTAIKHEPIEDKPQPSLPLQPQPDLIMQTNPVYNKPLEQENQSDNDEFPANLNEKANRFNSKKLKMKRANTIDIPKPLKYYEYDDDESDNEDVNNRRNSYLALRGPIHVGKLNVEKKVPEFEPKTESDRKFVAFLGKNIESSNDSNAKTLWSNQKPNRNSGIWSNKFGNIKNNFEKVQPSNSINSARNFWKSADDAVAAGRVSHIGPKISRQSARNLQQMFEEKQKQTQHHNNVEDNVVTGYLKVDTKSNKNVKVMTQPNPVNKFSHAPMSAFKPVAKKIEPPPQQISYLKPKPLIIKHIDENSQSNENKDNKTPEAPLYLYSPKPVSPQDTSPVNFTPWHAGRTGEGRVLSMAAAKFENHIQEKVNPGVAPFRRMSKEKIAIPPALIQQQNQPHERLTAPYLVKSVAQNSSVRKLSGQYDSMGNRDTYPITPNNRYHYDPKPRVFMPGENYTIKYDNPIVAKPPEPKIYNAEYTITQHYATPQTNEKSEQFAPVEPDESQQQIYNKPQFNRQQSYEKALMHNQLQKQQIYSKIQDNCDQSPVIEAHSTVQHLAYTQPKVYNEPTQYEDDHHQYTSSYQFQPQVQPKPVQLKERPDVIESSNHINRDSYSQNENSKSRDQYSKEDYYSGFADDTERGETENVFANDSKSSPKINDYNHQSCESNSSLKSVSYERQTSQEAVKEYTPVSSKVMSGPVSQQAVTVQQNAPKTRDQHDMEFNLKATLQKFSSKMETKEEQKITSSHYQKFQGPRKKSPERRTVCKEDVTPPHVVYNNIKQKPSFCVNDKPLSLDSLEINERGESVLTSKFQIPVKQVNLVPSSGTQLSKSDSWHQICQTSQSANKPSPRASPNSRPVMRSKSSHTLALPKQFEAGFTKTEMVEKRKTMEAYFGGASKAEAKTESKKSSINRVKTSQKVSTQRQNSTGLCRSKTLPDIVCLDKLDDNNIDAIFEDLFNSST